MFGIFSLAGLLVVGWAAFRVRGRPFGIFVSVLLTLHTGCSVALFSHVGVFWPVFVLLQISTYAHLLGLVWARPRPAIWRYLVSLPASYFIAAIFLATPWALVGLFGVAPRFWGVPFLLAGAGLLQSLFAREEEVDLELDGQSVEGLRPHPRGKGQSERPLRLVQITDPHIGAFMPVARLKQIAERAVAREPDLVLLTGDFLTMESQNDPRWLSEALAPLAALEGRVFACLGNHDHESLDVVEQALAAAKVELLVDREATVETPAGPVQILGADFVWSARAAHLEALTRAYPRRPGHLRVLLLHDPGAFAQLPEGEADLVLSGHTHGGQLGLLSLGLAWTVLRSLTSIPDHGFWARGRDRLYVHRGTGHYGFPLRLGVPAEQSLIKVHPPRSEPIA